MGVEEFFPNLEAQGFRETSERTDEYNCVAWAMGDSENWWEPIGRGYYWPPGLPFTQTVKGLALMLEGQGYERCPDGSLEEGYDKVVIYADGKNYEHIARQLPSGKWTSKLGKGEDIEHDTVGGLEGDEYGSAILYMKRPRP